jgi:uncharacterized protein YraI
MVAAAAPAGSAAAETPALASAEAPTLALTSASAQAAATQGKIIARSLHVRKAPTAKSSTAGSLSRGQVVSLDCKVPGPSVDGNARWYKLSKGGWVTARYVDNVGAAPSWCGGTFKGKVSATSLTIRTGPDTSNARVGTFKKGANVTIGCKVNGDTVGGNPRWYWVHISGRDGWVSARYVDNVGTIPTYC